MAVETAKPPKRTREEQERREAPVEAPPDVPQTADWDAQPGPMAPQGGDWAAAQSVAQAGGDWTAIAPQAVPTTEWGADQTSWN